MQILKNKWKGIEISSLQFGLEGLIAGLRFRPKLPAVNVRNIVQRINVEHVKQRLQKVAERGKYKRKKKQPKLSDDTRLFRLSKNDYLTFRNLCEGVLIFGNTGSGKTSGSGQHLRTALLSYMAGGQVHTVKPEDAADWLEACRLAGRQEQVIHVSPESGHRFNFIEYLAAQSEQGDTLTMNITDLYITLAEIDNTAGKSGGDPYWTAAMKQLISNAIDTVRLSGRKLTLDSIHSVINSLPDDVASIGRRRWQQQSECYQMLQEASSQPLTELQQHDLKMTRQYILQEWPAMGSKQRASIKQMYSSLADNLMRGTLYDMLGTKTTFVPEYTHHGCIIILDMPVKVYGKAGRYFQLIMKRIFQDAAERRAKGREQVAQQSPVFLWADEFQNFFSKHDYQFQATARSARVASVYITQNISNLLAVIGSSGQPIVDALSGSLVTKIFHANTDVPTQRWAADLIGKSIQHRRNFSAGAASRAGMRSNTGASEQIDYKIQPSDFAGLATGGPANQYQVQAIVFNPSVTFKASSESWLKVIFMQREAV
ncbi:MAG: type IV secretory system conjugative DNA transfer family protein [Calditrichota bacterium]